MDGVRNIGIVAHVDAGKTTLTERMLYLSGAVHRFGDVDDGTTVTDFGEQERERGITIWSAVVSMDWMGCRICVVDTPGHEDFSGEVVRCMNAVDGVVVVVSGVEGVEPQTERAWRRADGVPKIVFVNKMDRAGADFGRVLSGIEKAFGVVAVPMSEPLLDGLGRFVGVADAGRGESWTDRLCSVSDVALGEYLEFGHVSEATVAGELKRLCLEGRAVPVWCGSAKDGAGVDGLMDGVAGFLPSPCESRDRKLVSGEVGEKCFTGQVFKVSGDVFLTRVFTGSVKVGDVVEGFRGRRVKVQKMVDVQGRRQTDVAVASAGDIVGLCGLKGVFAGETLRRGCDAEYEGFEAVRRPLVSCSVEPRKSSDSDRLEVAVASIRAEDGTVGWSVGSDGGRVLSGMGALHLEVVLRRIEDEYGVAVRSGECVSANGVRLDCGGRVRTVCERCVGGKSARAEIECVFTVMEDGDCEAEVSCPMDGKLSERLRQGVLDGLATGVDGKSGVMVSAEVVSASWSGDVPPEGILYMAGAQCVAEAFERLGAVEMEPVVRIWTWVPSDRMGAVSGWMSAHDGVVESCSESGTGVMMECVVGVSGMLEFGKAMPSLTGGKGDFSSEPCGWRDVRK